MKDLDEIKTQMKEAICPCINLSFNKVYNSYSSIIREVNADLEKQMEQIRQSFISKFEKVIHRRIQEELDKEECIKAKLKIIQTNVNILNEKKKETYKQSKIWK